jgi:hypothetical protein
MFKTPSIRNVLNIKTLEFRYCLEFRELVLRIFFNI